MPKVNFKTESDWLEVYREQIRDVSHPQNGQWVGYGRLWAQRSMGPYDDELTRFNVRVAGLTSNFPIQKADRILIQGCGLGFIIEAFKSASYPNAFGIDNSPFVASKRAVEAHVDTIFIEDDVKGGAAVKTSLRNGTGDDIFDWVISESMLESYEDAELKDLLDAAEAVLDPTKPLTNIIHMVMSVQDPAKPDQSIGPQFNQKTLAEWVAMEPDHSWYDYVRGVVG